MGRIRLSQEIWCCLLLLLQRLVVLGVQQLQRRPLLSQKLMVVSATELQQGMWMELG
jgi:hypothetical protein